MSAADHDVKPGDSQDEVCKCGHLHAEHYGKVATARCTVCEGPARPVEDREPVGPYAPTRDGRTLNARYETDPGLFEAGYRQGWRERDTPGCVPRYPDLTIRDQPESGELTRPEYVHWKKGFDFGIKGFAEEMATARRETREAFERGRQQGDADRAQRGQTEFERGRASVQRSPLVTSELEGMFERGKTVGAAERESELLDQGWTPPGGVIDIEHELIDQASPTDYEVWRDALTLAVGHSAEAAGGDITPNAFWFHGLLMAGHDGARADVEQTRVTEHEAAADPRDIGPY